MNHSASRELRLAQLVVCISLATGSAVSHCIPHAPSDASMVHPRANVLRNQLLSMPVKAREGAAAGASRLVVDTCEDNNSAGSLRAQIAAAEDGDSIDLTTLSCSTITLTQGALPVLLDSLTLIGPGAQALRIDGANADRIFVHPGQGTLTLRNLAVQHGRSQIVQGYEITGGGCIASAGYVLLDHSVVSDCYAVAEGAYGGGIFAYSLQMYTSTLTRATALGKNKSTQTASFGGGAYVGSIFMTDSTVSGNVAGHDRKNPKSGYDIGGGVFANYGGAIRSSTISGNYATYIGGGLSTFGGYTYIINSTVSGNSAPKLHGGGVDFRTFTPHAIYNSTITNNTAHVGGGLFLRGAPQPLHMNSTIISANTSGIGTGADMDTYFDTTVIGANNLVVSADVLIHLPADTLHGDAQLQPLADNGGPTQTQALTESSPAIDAGNNVNGLGSDQRGPGFTRVRGVAPDIGAFEGVAAIMTPPVQLPTLATWAASVMAGGLMWLGRRRFRHKPALSAVR